MGAREGLGYALGVRVLVVEDSAPFRRRLTAWLSELPKLGGLDVDLDVEEAASCETALDALEQRPVELVLLDLRLGERSGLELIPLVKRRWPAAVLVVLTSAARAPYERVCVERGADFFFDKASDFEPALAEIVLGVGLRARVSA